MTSSRTFSDPYGAIIEDYLLPTMKKTSTKNQCDLGRCPHPTWQPECKCAPCSNQVWGQHEQCHDVHQSYQGHLEEKAARAEVDALLMEIHDHQSSLRRNVPLHCQTIIRRWQKGVNKRHAYLKRVDGLPRKSNPVGSLFAHAHSSVEQKSKRSAFLLPYLNIETLSKDASTFLKLLYHRSFTTPAAWVPFDNWQIEQAWRHGVIREKFSKGCIILTEQYFGHYKPFDIEDVHAGFAYCTPRALLILEAQATLMKRISALISVILQQPDPITTIEIDTGYICGTTAFPASLSKWSRIVYESAVFDQACLGYAQSYIERPFGPPPNINMEMLLDIAMGQTAEAQDEAWLLQTDPSYFLQCVKYKEQNSYANHADHAKLRVDSTVRYNKIGSTTTIGPVDNYLVSRYLRDEIALAADIMGPRILERLSKSTSLPNRYQLALSGVRALVSVKMTAAVAGIRTLIEKHDDFGKHFSHKVRSEEDNLHLPNFLEPNSSTQDLYQKHPLLWCLQAIYEGTYFAHGPALPIVLQFLDDYLASNPSDLRQINGEIIKQLSIITSSARIMDNIELQRPRIGPANRQMLRQNRPAFKWLANGLENFGLQMTGKKRTFNTNDMDIGQLLLPMNKFHVPKGKRTIMWLTECDAVYAALNTIWEQARKAYKARAHHRGDALELIEAGLREMSYGSSETHLQQLQLEKEDILRAIESHETTLTTVNHVPLSHDSSNIRPTGNPFRAPTLMSSKAKSRPQPDTPLRARQSQTGCPPKHSGYTPFIHTLQGSSDTQPTPVLYTFKPTDKIWVPLLLLFPSFRCTVVTTNSDSISICTWHAFVRTTTRLGFSAEHREGSAFTFRLAGNGVTERNWNGRVGRTVGRADHGAIVIHRPHPENGSYSNDDARLGAEVGEMVRDHERVIWSQGEASYGGSIDAIHGAMVDALGFTHRPCLQDIRDGLSVRSRERSGTSYYLMVAEHRRGPTMTRFTLDSTSSAGYCSLLDLVLENR